MSGLMNMKLTCSEMNQNCLYLGAVKMDWRWTNNLLHKRSRYCLEWQLQNLAFVKWAVLPFISLIARVNSRLTKNFSILFQVFSYFNNDSYKIAQEIWLFEWIILLKWTNKYCLLLSIVRVYWWWTSEHC